jgi:hypothetical protein
VCVTHYGLAIYIKKGILRQIKEEELWKLKIIFHHAKIYNLQKKKNPLKETKILQDISIIIIIIIFRTLL